MVQEHMNQETSQKSIWEYALQNENRSSDMDDEATLIITGISKAGKTSLISCLNETGGTPHPTTAMEYTFLKRKRGPNIKDVAHLWELAGGLTHAALLGITLRSSFLLRTSAVIVIDLSKPHSLWGQLEHMLGMLRAEMKDALATGVAKNKELTTKLQQQTTERLGPDFSDQKMVDPFPIPLVIVGNKYDIFQRMDPLERKIIANTLRFVAHTNGASLHFSCCQRQSEDLTRLRKVLLNVLFSTGQKSHFQVDCNRPLHVQAGMDSMEQIGSPPLSEGELGKSRARTPTELWKFAYISKFPPENITDTQVTANPALDMQFSEAKIDALRRQKGEELERYTNFKERRQNQVE